MGRIGKPLRKIDSQPMKVPSPQRTQPRKPVREAPKPTPTRKPEKVPVPA